MAPVGSESFTRRLDQLAERVGAGRLRGRVEVDQAYAQFQHEGLDLKHPRGGQAKFLEEPLYAKHPAYLEKVADAVLDGDAVRAMADGMEDLSDEVETLAPVEFTDLRRSGHPSVDDGPLTAYDRPPAQIRLTVQQLRAKAVLRRFGDGGFGTDLPDLYGG